MNRPAKSKKRLSLMQALFNRFHRPRIKGLGIVTSQRQAPKHIQLEQIRQAAAKRRRRYVGALEGRNSYYAFTNCVARHGTP